MEGVTWGKRLSSFFKSCSEMWSKEWSLRKQETSLLGSLQVWPWPQTLGSRSNDLLVSQTLFSEKGQMWTPMFRILNLKFLLQHCLLRCIARHILGMFASSSLKDVLGSKESQVIPMPGFLHLYIWKNGSPSPWEMGPSQMMFLFASDFRGAVYFHNAAFG